MILSRNMLKRVGESRHPCRTCLYRMVINDVGRYAHTINNKANKDAVWEIQFPGFAGKAFRREHAVCPDHFSLITDHGLFNRDRFPLAVSISAEECY